MTVERPKHYEPKVSNMNKLLISCFPSWALVFALALPCIAYAQQTDPNAALYRQAATIVSNAKAFDKATGNRSVQSFLIPYPTWVAKKTKVEVTVADKVVRKLTYASYDEGHKASGTETYYFDANGKFVCHVNKATGVLSYDVFIDSVLVLWTKPDDQSNTVMRGANAIFQQAANKYVIDYYLGAAGFRNYSSFTLSPKSKFRLRVLKDMPLHQSAAANSASLETLKKGSEVYYLDRSPDADSVASVGKWVWYKVSTRTGHSGWIWGYPTGVKEATDEE
jgi:hypothetical protein